MKEITELQLTILKNECDNGINILRKDGCLSISERFNCVDVFCRIKEVVKEICKE